MNNQSTANNQENKQRFYSIYKIKIGRYYYILKTTNISWFRDKILMPVVNNVEMGIENPLKGERTVVNPLYANLLLKMVENLQSKSPKSLKIEPILENTTGYKAIVKEYELLQKSYGKKTNLNSNKYPHIPQTEKTRAREQNNTVFTESDRANYIKYLTKKGIDWKTIYPVPKPFRKNKAEKEAIEKKSK